MEPDVFRALDDSQMKLLIRGPLTIVVHNDDVSTFQTFVHHGISNHELYATMEKAIRQNTKAICKHIAALDPDLLRNTPLRLVQTSQLAHLQYLISHIINLDAQPNVLQDLLEHAAMLGNSAAMSFFLQPGNRELNRHLSTGKGHALCIAATQDNLPHPCVLAESDDDISVVFDGRCQYPRQLHRA